MRLVLHIAEWTQLKRIETYALLRAVVILFYEVDIIDSVHAGREKEAGTDAMSDLAARKVVQVDAPTGVYNLSREMNDGLWYAAFWWTRIYTSRFCRTALEMVFQLTI